MARAHRLAIAARIGALVAALTACSSRTRDAAEVSRGSEPAAGPADGGAPLTAAPRSDAAPPAAGPRALAIGVGDHFSCALLVGGEVRCWGAAGLGGGRDPAVPTSIGVDRVTALAVGTGHACVVRDDGSLWCWGDNRNGQLGDGTDQARDRPAPVDGLADIVEVAAGGIHTCARDRAGAVWCWGHDGAVGHDGKTPARVPNRVASLPADPGARLVAGDDITCALFADPDQTPRCWGFNTTTLLGSALKPPGRAVEATALAGVELLAIGYRHACMVRRTDDGAIWCAGDDRFGQLGDQWVPDDAHCQPRGVRELECTWTDPRPAAAPRRGRPSRRIPRDPPAQPPPRRHTERFALKRYFVSVASGARAVALGAGHGRSCAVTRDAEVVCWGQWHGVADWAHRQPRVVPGTAGAVAVAVATRHACALIDDQSVRCWGYDTSGELGDGTVADHMTPVPEAVPVRW